MKGIAKYRKQESEKIDDAKQVACSKYRTRIACGETNPFGSPTPRKAERRKKKFNFLVYPLIVDIIFQLKFTAGIPEAQPHYNAVAWSQITFRASRGGGNDDQMANVFSRHD